MTGKIHLMKYDLWPDRLEDEAGNSIAEMSFMDFTRAESREWSANIVLACNSHDAMYGALKGVQEACLFADDDGQIGVTNDPHIHEALFDKINAALAAATPETKEQGNDS